MEWIKISSWCQRKYFQFQLCLTLICPVYNNYDVGTCTCRCDLFLIHVFSHIIASCFPILPNVCTFKKKTPFQIRNSISDSCQNGKMDWLAVNYCSNVNIQKNGTYKLTVCMNTLYSGNVCINGLMILTQNCLWTQSFPLSLFFLCLCNFLVLLYNCVWIDASAVSIFWLFCWGFKMPYDGRSYMKIKCKILIINYIIIKF